MTSLPRCRGALLAKHSRSCYRQKKGSAAARRGTQENLRPDGRYTPAMTKDIDRSAERAATRRSWPVRRFQFGAEPSDDLSAFTSPEERLAMMWPLALEAWELAGRLLPTYARSDAPVRCVRGAGAGTA